MLYVVSKQKVEDFACKALWESGGKWNLRTLL